MKCHDNFYGGLKMKIKALLAASVAGVMFAGSVLAGTLDDVRARGKLNCIINTGLAGFAAPDDKGNWQGFDVDFCKAVAAAVLGDANFTSISNATEYTTPFFRIKGSARFERYAFVCVQQIDSECV